MRAQLTITLAGLCLASAPFFAGCENPPPTCAAKDKAYEVCSDDQIWTCPVGDAETAKHNLQIDADCEKSSDPVQCAFDADYKMIEMKPGEDCAASEKTCVEDPFANPKTATCEAK